MTGLGLSSSSRSHALQLPSVGERSGAVRAQCVGCVLGWGAPLCTADAHSQSATALPASVPKWHRPDPSHTEPTPPSGNLSLVSSGGSHASTFMERNLLVIGP